MGSVWKRLQRVNKRAAKFQFTASYHELHLETTAKWRPSNLAVVWTRRSRRVASAPLPWEPDMMNPLVGHISWPVPDNHAISVTLFKDPRTHELEDKDWTFVIEDITPLGKKRVLASASINMRKYASVESTQQSFMLSLKPVSRKITSANLELTISCVFLREGKATDEDMESVVSFMSVNNNCDVAPLDDLEDIPDLESSGDISDHLFDFTQQLDKLTTSLNGCIDDLPTPLSVPSLSEDPTPLAELNRLNFELESDKQISDFDDALKTPSASTQPQQQQNVATTTSPTVTAAATTTAAEVATTSATTTTPAKPQRQHLPAKLFSSTPIAKVSTEKKPLEMTTTSTTTAAVNNNESARKALNFEKIEKQNGDLSQKPAKAAETVKTVETSRPEIHSSNLFSFIGGDKSTLAAASEKSSAAGMRTTPSVTTTDENNKTTISQQPLARSEARRAELQPLNLKKNYDNEQQQQQQSSNNTTTSLLSAANTTATSINNSNSIGSNHNTNSIKPVEKIILKENTPGQDLLEWCKEVTKDSPNVKVTNLTTSWRNGMAFCAIIHHFEPDLVDMSTLSAHDVVGNCNTAFDAAESLGIPRVIEPRDMSMLAVPDKLAVMTYLHQLRAHFTGKQLQIEQIGPTSDESSYVIGNYKSDNLSQNLLNLSHLKAHLLHQNSLDDDIFGITSTDKTQLSPTAKKDVKNLILSGSKSILGKVLSPAKDKNSINASQHSNLSLGNQTPPADGDPNGETYDEKSNASLQQDSEAQQQQLLAPTTTTSLDPNTANRILSRHKEMSEKAKMMIEKLKISNSERNENDEERQQRLREQARRLILETRTKATNGGTAYSMDSPTTPTKLKRLNFSPERTISPIHNGGEDYGFGGGMGSGSGSPKVPLSPTKKITPPRDIDTSSKLSPSHRLSERYNGSSPLQSFNAVMERISPKGEKKGDKLSYIESELEALEREQEAIDQKASNLEKKLRAVMGGNPSNIRMNRNPFLRMIRNSIGGGDSIRIKLLNTENGDEFSLNHSGEDSSPETSASSLSSEDEKHVAKNSDANRVRHKRRKRRPVSLQPQQRPRSQSCFVDSNQNHQQSHQYQPPQQCASSSSHATATHLPYSVVSSASSNQSSCDNFKLFSDEEDGVRRRKQQQQRRRSRSRSNCGESEETEEQLLSQWFTLVNKKNALLRRQMQLNILEQESDLERKYTMLNQELRAAQSVEDWRKTEAQREKERLLLEELVAIVDKRDQLVQRLHNQEIAIEDDHEIARELEQVDISASKEKCVIQ